MQYFVRKLPLKIYNSIYLLVFEVQKERNWSVNLLCVLMEKRLLFIDLITQMNIRFFKTIKQLYENSQQRGAASSHVVESLFCTAQKPQASISLRNKIFEHVWQFAGNITFCHALLAACPALWLPSCGRWGGRLDRCCVDCNKSATSYDNTL